MKANVSYLCAFQPFTLQFLLRQSVGRYFQQSLNSTQRHPLEQDFKKGKETLFTPLAINFFVLEICEALINRNNFKRTYLIAVGVEN